ncbi:hypothetical protein FACUT_9514 [Fusarium acutatum]|uniref:Helicase ATP-binding domain-containing protein n=1 Tax=Fusarium acutatum TaxID=78861 RepID=A0A8H4JH61_9HYPO|nr:hypothetical protein FACUT_9514 [Fusarium acutatum]
MIYKTCSLRGSSGLRSGYKAPLPPPPPPPAFFFLLYLHTPSLLSPTTRANAAYNNTSRGSVHALYEASFQKLTDAVSSDTSTVAHKAHCGRVDVLTLLPYPSSAQATNLRTPASSKKTALPHKHPANHLGNTDFHSHLDILDELNIELKHWQTTGVGKLVWLAKSPFKGGFLADAMGLGKGIQALVAAIQVKRTMSTKSGLTSIVTRAGCVLQWVDEIKRRFKPMDTTRLLDYDIVIFSRDFSSPDIGKASPSRISAIPEWRWGSPRLGSQISQNITVLILGESHDCRNGESLYFDAVKSLEYHHLFMLTGTPMFNRSEDIVHQSRFMLGGGLFSGLEHYRNFSAQVNSSKVPRGLNRIWSQI